MIHNHFVEHVLAKGVHHARQQIFRFTKKLMLSNSPEIRMITNLVAEDAESVTGSNLLNVEEEFGTDPWRANKHIWLLLEKHFYL